MSANRYMRWYRGIEAHMEYIKILGGEAFDGGGGGGFIVAKSPAAAE